jgi:Ca2+-binding RTX toxin-like protein
MTIAKIDLDAAKVAVFADGVFVDNDDTGGNEAELPNIKASLTSLGHTVADVTSITAGNLAGQDVFLIPELEEGSLVPSLDAAEIAAIIGFVAEGGTLVLHGDDGGFSLALANLLFGIDLEDRPDFDLDDQIEQNGEHVAGNTFSDDPGTVPGNDATNSVDLDSLPTHALSFYQLEGRSAAFGFGSGLGQVIFLGYDWYNAAPDGEQDNGWLDLLDSAISKSDGKINGNDGNNRIDGTHTLKGEAFTSAIGDEVNGAGGDDKLFGLGGIDFLNGGKGQDQAKGGNDGDYLYGEGGADLLVGGASFDSLFGGAGQDVLKGGADSDFFYFDTKLGGGNIDKLPDFVVGERIYLFMGVFTEISSGPLTADQFHIGGKATADTHLVIYNANTGALLYDADGKGGDAAVQFATLDEDLALTAETFSGYMSV